MKTKDFIEKYFRIIDKSGAEVPFELNTIQDRYLTQDLTGRDLIIKARQQGFCLDGNTQILTKDLRWIPIKDARVGQELIGVDENSGTRGIGRKMRTSVVEGIRTVHEEAYKITMSDGRILIATGQHRFLTHPPKSPTNIKWREVQSLKPGYAIRHIAYPWDKPTHFDAWFGGLLDGEAHLRAKSSGGASLQVTQVAGAVWDKMSLYAEPYSTRVDWDYRDHRANKPVGTISFCRMNELFEIIGKARPVRLITINWWEGLEMPGKRSSVAWTTIENIEPIGKQKMYDLQTSTKTFIAEGFVSHNSSLILAMFTKDFLSKENSRSVIVADISDNATELLDRVKRYIKVFEEIADTTVPLKYNSKYELYNTDMNSRYTIGTADNRDFGRSKTITNLHLSEFAFYPDAQKLFAGVMQAVVPDGKVIIETTANGMGFLKDFWDRSLLGETGFKPLFYGASEFYDQQFLLGKEKELGRYFKQEYPSNAIEAFLLSGDSFFDVLALKSVLENTKEPISHDLVY